MPLWIQMTLCISLTVFVSIFIVLIVSCQRAFSYGSDLVAERLSTTATTLAVQIEQMVQEALSEVKWTLERDAVSRTLYEIAQQRVSAVQTWETFTAYVENVVISHTSYLGMFIYSPNFEELYSYEHAKGDYPLTSLLSSINQILPLNNRTRLNVTDDGILAGPATMPLQVGASPAFSFSLTQPIYYHVNETNRHAPAHSELVGYGTIILELRDLHGEHIWENSIAGNLDWDLLETASNSTMRGYKFVLPRHNYSLSSSIIPFSTFPSAKKASMLGTNSTAVRPRGADLSTHTPFEHNAAVGYSYADVAKRRWLVLVETPHSEAFRQVHHQTQILAGIGCGILGFVFLVSVPFSIFQTSPLYKIYNGMEFKPYHKRKHYDTYQQMKREHKDKKRKKSNFYNIFGPDPHDSSRIKKELSAEAPEPPPGPPSTMAAPKGDSCCKTSDAEEKISGDTASDKHSYLDTVDTFHQKEEDVSNKETSNSRLNAGTVSLKNGMESARTSYAHSQIGMGSVFNIPSKLKPLNRRYRDELDDLVFAYNKMVDELNNQYKNLDDQVRARTREAEEARQLAEAANKAKSLFIANITHELRTPLNGIMGMTSVALTETDRTKIMNALYVILESGRILMELLSELLAFSKSQIDLKPEVKPFTPKELLDSLQSLYETRAVSKSVSLALSLHPMELTDVRLIGDSYRALQVAINCLSNALKFTDSGGAISVVTTLRQGIDKHISMKPYEKANCSLGSNLAMLEVIIRDSGIGISRKQLATMFELFVQGDAPLSKRHQGAGLGMSMSKQLAEGIGGYIVVYSAEAAGTMVILRIPVGVTSQYIRPDIYTSVPVQFRAQDVYWTISFDAGVIHKAPAMRPLRPPPKLQIPVLGRRSGGNTLKSVSRSPSPTTPKDSRHFRDLSSATNTLSSSASHAPDSAVQQHADLPIVEIPSDRAGLHSSHSSVGSRRMQRPVSLVGSLFEKSSGQVKSHDYKQSEESILKQNSSTGLPDPLESAETRPSVDVAAQEAAAQEEEFRQKKHPNLRILVADDNQLNLQIMKRMLQRLGVEHVDIASDGATAIQMVEQSIIAGVHYSVIFMDLVMPGVSGIEATQVIRGTLGYPYPIVALTGYADQQTRDVCKAAAIQEVLQKPIIKTALLRMLIKYEH